MKKLWRSAVTCYGKSGELKNLRCLADAQELQEMAINGKADRECLRENPVLRLFKKGGYISYVF